MALFSDLIRRTELRLRMAGGPSVQTYADPIIAEFLQYAFDQLFIRRFWNQHRKSSLWTLDGTTGLVTTDISSFIKSYSDIQYIWLCDAGGMVKGSQYPLPSLPFNVNEAAINLTSIRPYADATKVFQVMPVTTDGQVRVQYRTKPAPFIESDNVPMDDHLLILSATYEYLSDDGANLKAADRVLKMFTNRLNQLEKLEDNQDRSLYSYSNSGINDWRDRDA